MWYERRNGLFTSREGAREDLVQFDNAGKFITRIGSSGKQPGQWDRPSGFAIDGQGQLYVASGRTVLIYGANGNYMRSFDVDKFIDNMLFTDTDELVIIARSSVTKYELGR